MADKHLDTALVHAGRSKKYTLGSVNSVIQRASSLVFDTVEAKKHATRNRAKGELFYGRRGTLTHFSLQEAMCELEGGAGCALFPCGAAAVANTILAFVEQGDHILVTNTAYEPTQDFCTKILAKLGVHHRLVRPAHRRRYRPSGCSRTPAWCSSNPPAPSPWKSMMFRRSSRRYVASLPKPSL
ncbi:cystathionine beta-lyase [Klebsiella michiganensis]|nr:cystathionine beta-lyase [Klebsiella michiganensis]